MTGPVKMVELWRGGLLESWHVGHAAVWSADAGLIEHWGEPETVIFPRSSCKMLQALPLLESGAGEGLSSERLALACASHQGSERHTRQVGRWLSELGLGEGDLRCGAHMPADVAERDRLVRAHEAPCQLHNNCSGKHAGFLMLSQRLKAGPEYVEIDHPVQRAVRAAFEEVTGEESPGFGIDGCSAPNFATTVAGLARAMAFFAAASAGGGARERAAARLVEAMIAHPDLVAGEGRACTELMRAMRGRAAIKTGAEAVFVAIVPEKRLGIALKIVDGATRASEAAIAALLVRHGMLDAGHPATLKRLNAVQSNWRGIETGIIRKAEGFA
ncbi:asparaginase [Cereibacter azotoformans]|uniref:Asparaginase n=1 Tax=Cereibacter azotoformans TaxID=43057 RepID=A0A2T5JU71_9RHOB|nr:asparaginase [Cereibacter azotoformans]AXQ92372.1 asparaginase [Cereibacter sphaeroides]MBO4170062.1 asparaginase [Cereibacter azotoformans]PTR13717.1 asparaginase [Cereibacter azotoformans]UIJ30641.1 asparaginase [Cereibacter azotoformans]